MLHADPSINTALTALQDALDRNERATGVRTVLILRDDQGFCHRCASGKPVTDADITDEQLLRSIR